MSQTVILAYQDADEIVLATDGTVITGGGGASATVEVLYPVTFEWEAINVAVYTVEGGPPNAVTLEIAIAPDGSTFGALTATLGGVNVASFEEEIQSGAGGGFTLENFTAFFTPGVSRIRMRLVNGDPGDTTIRRAIARFARARTNSS